MPKTEVLFLCTHNSCRSQMAEGFLRPIAGWRIYEGGGGVKGKCRTPFRSLFCVAERAAPLT
jgi:protein-tyrosine-phosphatase